MNNSSQTKLAVVAAVLVGLFAVIAVNKYVKTQTERPAPPTATVLVATMEILEGGEIGPEMLSSGTIPLEALSNTHITLPAATDPTYEKALADIQAKFVGRKAKRVIAANTPIFWMDIDTEPKAPFADLIGDGNRAVTMPVDGLASVSGFIRPGSRIDVVLTASEDALGLVTGTQAGGGKRIVSSVILQNVPVIAVGRNYELESDTANYNTITLNLPTRAAIMMVQARSMGQITYLLRNVHDGKTERDRNVLTISPGASFGDAVRSF